MAGSWGPLQGKVMRVGHMGIQASPLLVSRALWALGMALRDLGLNVDPAEAVSAALESFKP